MPTVRVRFAPSPTGFLHVGGLRTALYNYLFARKNGGSFILRIEDTDRARCVEGAAESLMETLRWAGLQIDEGPGTAGGAAPYVQSERLAIYRRHAEELLEKGRAYYAFDSLEELEEMRKLQEKTRTPVRYDRRALRLAPGEIRRKLDAGIPHVVRMRIPDAVTVSFDDQIRGRVEFSSDQLDDQVILKSDGYPTYHLANVVDDHLMGISHVIRGEEWLSSTPKHVLLYEYFGWPKPAFAHLPLLLNPDKSKLSKRQGDVAVEEYRKKGYLPEALVNFVAFLGWNPGDEREVLSKEELIRDFSLERVGKAGAVFNIQKLNWLNAQHLRKKSGGELLVMLREALAGSSPGPAGFDDAYLLRVIALMRERMTFIGDIVEKSPYFFRPPDTYDPESVSRRWKQDTPDHLKTLAGEFLRLEDSRQESYEAALERTAGALQISKSDLIHPLRLAVSGTGAGPGLYDILAILGRDETICRITSAIERIH